MQCQAFSSEEEEKPKEWNMTAEMIKAGIIPKVLPVAQNNSSRHCVASRARYIDSGNRL
ncbi:hypothetical protein U1Q18_050139 [Sarracenia purpurea var. burkii]